MSRGVPAHPARVANLGGGVSNTVLLTEFQGRRIVVKQSLEKLRVAEEWISDRNRIARECQAMQWLAPRLGGASVPAIVFEDLDNCIFSMEAADPAAKNWKDRLLAGELNPDTAAQVGSLLGRMISVSWRNDEAARAFGDQRVFRQLRVDPYYRTTAARHPDLANHFEHLIERSAARRVSLVHGDWSPKNFLVHEDRVVVIDFEVIHFGDPSYDAAFLLNHFLLKSIYLGTSFSGMANAFWDALSAAIPAELDWLQAATIQHLGCLLLARVDGKSPAEYIRSEEMRDQVRSRARNLILHPPSALAQVFAR